MFKKVEEGTKCLSLVRMPNDLLILSEILCDMMRPREL